MRAAFAIAFFALASSACATKKSSSAGGDTTASAAPPPPAAASARRPKKKWYLANTSERCTIYSVEGDVTFPSITTPCPPDLTSGERIRIAGKTCIRESDDPSRVLPVVCPDPLTNAEKKDLAAEGHPQ